MQDNIPPTEMDKVQDLTCGFRAIRVSAYPKLKWESIGYGVEMEMLSRAKHNGLKVGWVPIDTIYIDKTKGTTIFDGIWIGLSMVYWKIRLTLEGRK